MIELNNPLLTRIADRVLATLPKSSPRTAALESALTGGAGKQSMTVEQAMGLLRHAVSAWLRDATPTTIPGVVARLDPPTAGLTADRGTLAHELLRVLITDMTAALSRAAAQTQQSAAFDAARILLLRDVEQRLRMLMLSPGTIAADDLPAPINRQDGGWPAFAWMQPAPTGRATTSATRAWRRRGSAGSDADDEEPPLTGQQLPRNDHADAAALLDIVEWLSGQRGDGDYAALLSGTGPGQRRGQMLDDAV